MAGIHDDSNGGMAASAGARLILERRDRLPERFSLRDVQRKCWVGLGNRDAVEAAICRLMDTYNIRMVVMPQNPAGGPAVRLYEWHPEEAARNADSTLTLPLTLHER